MIPKPPRQGWRPYGALASSRRKGHRVDSQARKSAVPGIIGSLRPQPHGCLLLSARPGLGLLLDSADVLLDFDMAEAWDTAGESFKLGWMLFPTFAGFRGRFHRGL